MILIKGYTEVSTIKKFCTFNIEDFFSLSGRMGGEGGAIYVILYDMCTLCVLKHLPDSWTFLRSRTVIVLLPCMHMYCTCIVDKYWYYCYCVD